MNTQITHISIEPIGLSVVENIGLVTDLQLNITACVIIPASPRFINVTMGFDNNSFDVNISNKEK